MPLGQPIDRDRALELLKAGKSNAEIAEDLEVSASAIANLKTRLRKEGLLEGGSSARRSTPGVVQKSDQSSTQSVPKSAKSTPEVVRREYFGTPEDVDDLRELLAWWRKRKARASVPESDKSTPEEYERRTFIIRRDLVERIRRYAEAEGVPIKTAFNQIVIEGLANLERERHD